MMQFDENKFRQLIHYVIAMAGDIKGFGSTKLYKVLWFSDARAYMLFSEPLTGEVYIRQKYGPIPKHIFAAVKSLERDGVISIRAGKRDTFESTRYKSLIPPDQLPFNAEQKKVIDYFIHHIAYEQTAKSISDKTHDDLAWEIAKMGEEIPYKAIFANRIREPNEEEKAWGRAKAKELGLN